MEVKMPSLGEGVESGTIARILVSEGDPVEADQDLFEIESDKAVASLPSPTGGTITSIRASEGQEVSEGDVLAEIEESETAGKESGEKDDEARDHDERDTEDDEPSEAEEQPSRARAAPEQPGGEPPERSGDEAPASPSVRRTALNLGIDLSQVAGSGKGGRIEMADLKAWVDNLRQSAGRSAPQPAPLPDFSTYGEILRKPLNAVRRATARRMLEACQTIPQVTQFGRADFSRITEAVEASADSEQKITPTVALLTLLPALLKEHGWFNASYDAERKEIVLKEYIHIGVATATERGLMVPVIRDVDRKSAADLANELASLARQARDGELDASAMEGGSFTISNQGGIGGDAFTPVVNPPQSAILGVGRCRPAPTVVDGEVVIRPVAPLALTYDHRVADGAQAAALMEALVAAIENVDAAALTDGGDS